MMRIHSLRNRIAIFFVLLVLAVQLASYSVVSTVISSTALKTLNQELLIGQRVFEQLLRLHSDNLGQAASVIASDFGFRAAIATHDEETILSALRNQGARVNADVVMLVGLDGRLLADTHAHAVAGHAFAFPRLIDAVRRKGRASAIGLIDGKVYQLVAVPVMAPLPIAWITMGFAIDDEFARSLKELTSLDVSFRAAGERKRGPLLASSLPARQRTALANVLQGLPGDRARNVTLTLLDDDYAARMLPMGKDATVVAVLQHSLAEATAPFRRVQTALLTITLLGLAISVAVSVLTARGVTRPVAALTCFARRVGEGDYSATLAVRGHDEISELAATFNGMRADLAEREKRIMTLAYEDPLTALPNRALFNDRLGQTVAQAKRRGSAFAMMTMDLDRFKYVNDTLGHPIGDQLLREVGARLYQALEGEFDTLARLGGDEFGILLPTSDLGAALAFAQRLTAMLERPITVGSHVVDVSASIGIVGYPQHGADAHTLLRRADVAMYTAKRKNHGCTVYDQSYDQHSPQRLSLMGELRRAVERDELTLYYQPKIDLADPFEVRQVEALIRWVHPERGFIPPDQFIPFAEQTGYIRVVSQWVAEQAIRQCARWRSEGHAIDISINISARDLLTRELPDLFQRLLPLHGVAPEWLCIEITESAIMEDPARALATLDQLHEMGLRLSIDDFGTGYSSLAYLKRLPVDEIKIDRSFVMGMEKDKDDEVIVRSTIDLGHNMGVKVTAEGVESGVVMDRLRELHCNMVQGFHMSRPLPLEQFDAWLTAWHAQGLALQPREVATI